MTKQRSIYIQGARTHNLKNISCDIPHGKLTVITGPSGSGKSSLAFDTLYAEGQRRFLESMSTYARQFLERIEKPDVEQIQNILPAIALEQKNHIKNARSTVGTATEIYDFLRVFFATIGITHCDACDGIASQATPQSIEADLKTLPAGTKLILTAPVSLKDFSIKTLIAQGYFRTIINGETADLNQDLPADFQEEQLEIIIDRLVLKGEDTSLRLLESIRKVLEMNPHQVNAHLQDKAGEQTVRAYQTQFTCQQCHKPFTQPFPNLFSFNNPLGACKACEGFGKIIGLDLDKVIPNRKISLEEGAIHPFNSPSNQELYDLLIAEGKKRGIQVDIPFEALSDDEKAFVLDGAGRYCGVYDFFEWLESKKYKVHVRVMLAKYRGYYHCPECHGSRLKPEALQVQVNGHNIYQLCIMPITELVSFFDTLSMTPEQQQVTQRLLREIQSRLHYLKEIGLGYLTLARQSRTLSGGEAQRINLSSALGSALTDTLYVLDEPTVGLHARDTQRLLSILKALRNYGNTIVVVEHDPEVIIGVDKVIDLGPTGGRDGGHVVY
jgi:excinuclease ABC subunit A